MYKSLYNIPLLLCFTALTFAALADETCPKQFFELTLPDASKQCRVFGVKKPSTLSFYLNTTPSTVIQTFKNQLPDAQQLKTHNMWSLLSEQPKVRIYVYPDGAGTQVNIRAE